MNEMLQPLRIVYVGPLPRGSTCRQRAQALRALGHDLVEVDQVPGDVVARQHRLTWRIQRRLFGDRDDSRLNERLLAVPDRPVPDVLWVDKGLTLLTATLHRLRERWPEAVFVNYSGDDMFNPHNQNASWRENVPLYDVFATTKSFNVPELKHIGARHVLFADKGFSTIVHRPHVVTPELRQRLGGDVGFVGWPEGAREHSMRHLARHGIDVRVWGPWPRWKSSSHLRIEGRSLWDDDYAAALSAFRINLGFLRRANRDCQTTRSIEIPACGGFLLAERTEEHKRLFVEDVEAVFFSDDRELLDKTRYYLTHDEEREQIALAGLQRCVTGRYAYDERLTFILRHALRVRTVAA